MRIVIASDDEATALSLRQWLTDEKLGADVQLLSLASVADRAAQYRPQCIILYVPDQPKRAIPIIRNIQEGLQTRILVIGPAAEAKAILRILREGASQYIDQEELEEELRVSLSHASAGLPPTRDFGNLIVVVGAGGGTGASTLAANLATGLSQRYQQCGLFDLRMSSRDLETFFDLQPAYTIASFCRKVDQMDDEMFTQCLAVHSSGVHLMAAPNSFREFASVTPRGVRKALGMARVKFKYVLVDLDSPFQPGQSQILYHADTLLLVIRLDFASVRQAQELLSYFDELGLERDRVQVVVSRYGRPGELRLRDVEATLGIKVRHSVPDDARRVNQANNQGIPIVLNSPRSTVSRSLIKISHLINGKDSKC